MAKPIIDNHYEIKKQPVKGGWHYVVLPGIPSKERNAQGLVRVRGHVESFKLSQYNLLPMKNGDMLLPLKTELRKKIKRKEGDKVHVKLFIDNSSINIPEYILDSLLDSPKAYDFFMTLSDSNKKYYIDWVEESVKPETKVSRIVKMITQLEKRRKFWDWPAKP